MSQSIKKIPSRWIRKRAIAYIKNGENVESARDHAIMDYLDAVYTNEADFILYDKKMRNK